tara:strand:- start:1539 stop:1790 length:252 start_codon:yes stop_codon:yes gene_type:complete
MLKILLPLLILFSMSSLAGLPLEPSYAAPDYLESESVMIALAVDLRPCLSENEPFERMYIVTGAATQYKETTYTSNSDLIVMR